MAALSNFIGNEEMSSAIIIAAYLCFYMDKNAIALESQKLRLGTLLEK